MDRRIGRLADAQTASSPPSNTQFDGTYAFVSVMHVNETYPISGTNRIGQCPNSAAERLTIVNGQAQYSDSGGQAQYSASGSRQFEGTVGSHGELVMRMCPAQIEMSVIPQFRNVSALGSGAGRARSPSVAQRPTDARLSGARNRTRCLPSEPSSLGS